MKRLEKERLNTMGLEKTETGMDMSYERQYRANFL